MTPTAELASLQRTLDDLRGCVEELRRRYGDTPAVRRLQGDVERMDLDAAELRDIDALPEPPRPAILQVIDDRPDDPGMWADADDEGLGGYLRSAR